MGGYTINSINMEEIKELISSKLKIKPMIDGVIQKYPVFNIKEKDFYNNYDSQIYVYEITILEQNMKKIQEHLRILNQLSRKILDKQVNNHKCIGIIRTDECDVVDFMPKERIFKAVIKWNVQITLMGLSLAA